MNVVPMNLSSESAPGAPARAAAPSWVLALHDPQAGMVARCGGKGARLAQLFARGLPVPPAVILTTEAAQLFAGEAGLSPSSAPSAVRAAPLPAALVAQLRAGLAALGDGPLAVRSSAVGEDGAVHSFAGLYETVLDVRGEAAVLDAVRRVWASAHDPRVASYAAGHQGCLSVAVVIQRQVAATAAGVAFTADPVSGERGAVLVSAVRGLGESLVSGLRSADEWTVRGERAERRRDDGVLDAQGAHEVAALARRVAALDGGEQDIEWAMAGGALFLLQARPLTALPERVEWTAPWGGWVRNFRLGEWIGSPVTPSFESWLLEGLERTLHDHFEEVTGLRMPRPAHVVLHGWYFYGLNLVGPERFAGLRQLARLPLVLFRLITRFRDNAAITPPLARFGFDHAVQTWREQLAPALRREVEEARVAVEVLPVESLPGLIDDLARRSGRGFASSVAVAGYAAKAEFPLVLFFQEHLDGLEGSWLQLVREGDVAEPAAHDVQDLDWSHPTLGELALGARKPDPATRARIVRERDELAARARERLGARERRRFDALLAEARRAHAIREEQARELTLAWPVLRRAMARIAEALVVRRVIARAEQVWFLTRDEILAALGGSTTPLAAAAEERRATRERQRRLTPPLRVGRCAPMYENMFALIDRALHGEGAASADELRGHPGSPGVVTGRARVLRSVEELDRLREGEILVAPVTTPAWTPAFLRAAAVVTDSGSITSHASIVAREYGLPAVVAVGDATSRLRDGDLITVDGGRGVVRLGAGPALTPPRTAAT